MAHLSKQAPRAVSFDFWHTYTWPNPTTEKDLPQAGALRNETWETVPKWLHFFKATNRSKFTYFHKKHIMRADRVWATVS